MKAIQNSHKSKTNIIYNLMHYILYIVHFITQFFTYLFSLLRRFVSNLRNKVLGLYSFKTLWRRSRTFNKYLNAATATSSVLFILLSIATIIPIYSKVNEAEAAINEQTVPTLTVNVTNGTASLDLVVRDNSGTFASSSTSGSNVTFTVATNNFTGYTLGIKSSSNNTDLTNTSTNPNSILETISSSMDSDTFDDENYNGKWGYLPSKYNSSSNTTTYYPSPAATGTTLDKTSIANSTANSYTIAIGARADYSKPTGTYSNTYILTTVINGFDYSISYNKGNTADVVTNLPNAQTASATSDSGITLSTTKPTRSGYDFKGWCSVLPTTSSDVDSCSGDTYAASATYYFNKTVNNSSITLYAMWEKAITNVGYLQDVTLNTCAVNVGTNGNAANIGDMLLATDRRDNNTYTIRYINGYCWMTQNLRITGTIDNTNGWSNFSASSFNASQYSLADSTNCTGSEASASTPKGYTNVCSYNSGDTDYGAYYNYAAATAGTVTGYTNSAAATQDICPAGWHLPTGAANDDNSEFYQIYQNTTANVWTAPNIYLTAFNGKAAGIYVNGTFGSVDAMGYWWSATAINEYQRWRVYYRSSDGYFLGGTQSGPRYFGLSVRCVMAPTYMQDITAAQLATLMPSNGDSATLTDKRDGQKYTVARIDDKYIMTQNLNYIGGTNGVAQAGLVLSSNGTTSSMTSSTEISVDEAYYWQSDNKDWAVYYNYCAASGKSVCTDKNSSNASDSICPSGWMLPSSDGANSLGGVSTSNLLKYGNLSVFAGLYAGSPAYQNRDGIWWTSTVRSGGSSTCNLLYDTSGNLKANGTDALNFYMVSLRCIKV